MSEMIQIKLTGLDKASAEVVEATHRGILTGLEAAGVEAVGEVRSEERRVGKECRSRWSPYH